MQALEDVSFSVPPGGALGLIGPNGAGKSTVLRLIAGVHRPDAGAITFGAERLDRVAPYAIPRLASPSPTRSRGRSRA